MNQIFRQKTAMFHHPIKAGDLVYHHNFFPQCLTVLHTWKEGNFKDRRRSATQIQQKMK